MILVRRCANLILNEAAVPVLVLTDLFQSTSALSWAYSSPFCPFGEIFLNFYLKVHSHWSDLLCVLIGFDKCLDSKCFLVNQVPIMQFIKLCTTCVVASTLSVCSGLWEVEEGRLCKSASCRGERILCDLCVSSKYVGKFMESKLKLLNCSSGDFIKVGKAAKIMELHRQPTPLLYTMSLSVTSPLSLYTSSDGDSSTSPASPFQCLTTLLRIIFS